MPPQPHYDYGMRAVKTVISAAGRLKQLQPFEEEERILLLSLESANLPKFLQHDVPLFRGILSDLFPRVGAPPSPYSALRSAVIAAADAAHVSAEDAFLSRCVQLWDTIQVRHGVMVIGSPGSGKSTIVRTLAAASTQLSTATEEAGLFYPAVSGAALSVWLW